MKNAIIFLFGLIAGMILYHKGHDSFCESKKKLEGFVENVEKKFSHLKFLTLSEEEIQKEESLAETNSNTQLNNSSSINFVKNSNVLPIEDAMVMKNETEFARLSDHYLNILHNNFYENHIKCIKQIIISDCQMFDENTTGLTSVVNGKYAYILLAAYSPSPDRDFLHEVCHAIHMTNEPLFNSKFKDRWESCGGDYVSDYARTSIYEDFAETGAEYLSGNISKDNPKFELFKEFYNLTK